jgi:NADH-quinone oxidoreductase subunit M
MAVCLLGLFSFNVQGLEGGLLMMVGHGLLVRSFPLYRFLYDRYKTRVVHYYGGLAQTMPLLASSMNSNHEH